ncbi:HEAT repeat domain-containing protein [Methanobrevibacter sp.]|uniref:HEAT repeat domain-containing protein n=1 Tax=Methanobrevibacter sp. TaxID=66852 RepID=UPI00388CFC3D
MYDYNLNDRLNSVRDTTSEKKLKRYALEDCSEKIREIAVSKITDPALLCYIVKNDRNINVVKRAIQNIDDEEVLNNLFMELSKIGIANYEIYYAIIEKIASVIAGEKLLAEIAFNDSRWAIRREAVRKITSQEVLVEIALNNSDCDVRQEAVRRITNQDVLAEISLNDSDPYVRREAVGKITNQDVLAEIASNDYPWICYEAVKRITSQEVLVEIALNNQERDVCSEAVRRITNQEVLVEILLNDSYDNFSGDAIEGISDKEVLLEILSVKSPDFVMNAADKINDQLILLDLALSNEDVAENLDEESRIFYYALKKEVS